VEQLWLFGSRVRGDHRDDSDVDLAILTVGDDDPARLGNFINWRPVWQRQLQDRLALPVQIEFLIDTDTGREALRYGVRLL
jgi:predicted nucleotidyltransferase